MKLLLDSVTLLRWMRAPRILSLRARRSIEDQRNQIHASVASIYELEFKERLGKLQFSLPSDWRNGLEVGGFIWLPIRVAHASKAASLALLHRDPWDRVIVAQALEEGLTLVTNDAVLANYGARTLW